MTDKEQIMIDGIQFNEFGDFYVDYDFNGKFQSISSSSKEYKILKSLIEQLGRKTQECEQKEKELLSNEKIINKLMKEVDELKQECDTLKSQLDFEVQQKECIKQECEELKAQLNDMACMDDDNVLCYPRQELKKECERYKQALDEIAEHYEKVIKNLTTYDEVYDANISIEALHNISDIINKTKDGE